ncbi:hypothetical protein [Comamonas thiooxydans]|uniref:hypothetical protein n=1 Tax=Comamonas thiooxydans TaxID=363952 RepID=UPI00209C3D97|nr:hypothetical protein [Comamonas thiooxydans]
MATTSRTPLHITPRKCPRFISRQFGTQGHSRQTRLRRWLYLLPDEQALKQGFAGLWHFKTALEMPCAKEAVRAAVDLSFETRVYWIAHPITEDLQRVIALIQIVRLEPFAIDVYIASDRSPESRDGRWGLSETRFVVLRSQVARPGSGQELPTTADF